MYFAGILLVSVPEEPEEKEREQTDDDVGACSKAMNAFWTRLSRQRAFYFLIVIRVGFTLVPYTIPNYYKSFGLALGCA